MSKEKCTECGGSGTIDSTCYGGSTKHVIPCHCQQKPEPAGELGTKEFVKNLLDFTGCSFEEVKTKLIAAISIILDYTDRITQLEKEKAKFEKGGDVIKLWFHGKPVYYKKLIEESK